MTTDSTHTGADDGTVEVPTYPPVADWKRTLLAEHAAGTPQRVEAQTHRVQDLVRQLGLASVPALFVTFDDDQIAWAADDIRLWELHGYWWVGALEPQFGTQVASTALGMLATDPTLLRAALAAFVAKVSEPLFWMDKHTAKERLALVGRAPDGAWYDRREDLTAWWRALGPVRTIRPAPPARPLGVHVLEKSARMP